MRRYTIFQAPPLAFVSRAVYQDVAWNWRGAGFLYLLFLLAVCTVLTLAQWHLGIAHVVTDLAPPIIDQIPPITIKNGQVSAEAEQPYTIKDPKTGKPLAIIDTTGEVTALDDSEAVVLLTRNKLILRKGPTETQANDLSQIQSFYVDKPIIVRWLRLIKSWFALVAYPFVLLIIYIGRILQALVYALIGLIFASMVKVKLSYPTLMRLAVVATTPAILLNIFVELMGIQIPWWNLICFVLAMGYLYFGVKAASAPRPDEEADTLEPPPFPNR